MKMGFELNINEHKYRVRCDIAIMTGTQDRDYSNNVNLKSCVYDENNKMIKLDRRSYVAEKISDFIRNCINGQDTIYWNWDKPNRHLDNRSEYDI